MSITDSTLPRILAHRVATEKEQDKSPVPPEFYVVQIAINESTTPCITGLAHASDTFGDSALYDSNDAVAVVLRNLGKADYLDLTSPMPFDVAETKYLRAVGIAMDKQKDCRCFGHTKFRLAKDEKD
jgi:hypothetical protein